MCSSNTVTTQRRNDAEVHANLVHQPGHGIGGIARELLDQCFSIDGRVRIVESFSGRLDGVAVEQGILLDALSRTAPQAEIVAVYGSTEAEPIALFRSTDMSGADRLAMASGSGLLAGFPVPGISVRLIRESTPAQTEPLTEITFAEMCSPAAEAGEIVVVMDDDGRENEGDLIVAAVHCTPEKMAFIVRHTSGIVCAPLTTEDARRLRLEPMPAVQGRALPKGSSEAASRRWILSLREQWPSPE